MDVIGALAEQDSMLSQFTSVMAACKSSGERAARGLDMLVRLSGAVGGVLYVCSSGRTMPRAQAGRLVPDEKIDALAREYLASRMNEHEEARTAGDVSAVTSLVREWKGPGDVRYVPVLLSHEMKQGLAITGVAVLMIDASARFDHPAALATELSRLCHKAGDIVVTIV